jgi:hypothetical protein
MSNARTETWRLGGSRRPPGKKSGRRSQMLDVLTASKQVLAMFVSVRKKAIRGATRSISTDARKGSNSTPLVRLQPGERGFRESTAFYSLQGWLRDAGKKIK